MRRKGLAMWQKEKQYFVQENSGKIHAYFFFFFFFLSPAHWSWTVCLYHLDSCGAGLCWLGRDLGHLFLLHWRLHLNLGGRLGDDLFIHWLLQCINGTWYCAYVGKLNIVMFYVMFYVCKLIYYYFSTKQFTGTQILCFLLAIFGTAILLEHATYDSRIQPMIRHTMNRLIMTSEYQPSTSMLKLIQESVSFYSFGFRFYTHTHTHIHT